MEFTKNVKIGLVLLLAVTILVGSYFYLFAPQGEPTEIQLSNDDYLAKGNACSGLAIQNGSCVQLRIIGTACTATPMPLGACQLQGIKRNLPAVNMPKISLLHAGETY